MRSSFESHIPVGELIPLGCVTTIVAGLGRVYIYSVAGGPGLIGRPKESSREPVAIQGWKFPDGSKPDFVDKPTRAVNLWIERKAQLSNGSRQYMQVVLDRRTVLVIHGSGLCGGGRLNPWCRSLH